MANPKYEEWKTEAGLVQLEDWAERGLTNEQIAKNMGIAASTLYVWMDDHPEISESIKRGKAVVDQAVENALYNRAIGFQFEEEKYVPVEIPREELDEIIAVDLDIFNEQNPKATQAERDRFILSIPTSKHIVVERKTKFIPPDTTAAIFWLKNRRPHEWRDKQDINIDGDMALRIEVDYGQDG